MNLKNASLGIDQVEQSASFVSHTVSVIVAGATATRKNILGRYCNGSVPATRVLFVVHAPMQGQK